MKDFLINTIKALAIISIGLGAVLSCFWVADKFAPDPYEPLCYYETRLGVTSADGHSVDVFKRYYLDCPSEK